MRSLTLVGIGIVMALVMVGGADRGLFGKAAMSPLAGTPRALSQIPVTQAFRMHIGVVGELDGSNLQYPPFVYKTNSSTGWAITEISSPTTIAPMQHVIMVKVNGVFVFHGQIGMSHPAWCQSGISVVTRLDPPIVVPPSGVLEIGTTTGSFWYDPISEILLAGYTLTAADLGG
jgi:hypothetical protein